MKKLLLLLTMSLTLTSFALNNTDKDIITAEDYGICTYSINTYMSDGSVLTRTYSTTASSLQECQGIALRHVEILSAQL